ncbi:hypothetical protein AALP_AAs38949U000100 [Arabis alpina]|uniref:Cytochrome p450 n=1 Tax=Arabis alpina TaxID=50452 RepID=A0A087FX33_ARAAL|nr:hypothetical protein AALP_AAs38949U000100 [Arabis alpina]
MIFNSDGELWKNQRKAAQFMLNHHEFLKLSGSATRSKLKDGLVPLFNHFSEEEMVVDLQDVFQRFTFDTTFFLVTGLDPKSVSTEMPEAEYAKAIDDLGEGIFYRHVIPKFLWKLQNRIGLGQEKRMTEADATFDRVSAKYISAKRKEVRSQGLDHHSNVEGPEFQEVFEIFGDAIINTDGELWRDWRNALQDVFSHQGYPKFSTSTTRSKLKDGLVPFFNHLSDEDMVVDLQDVFLRYMFDTTFILVTGSDPRSLCIEMPEVEFAKALDDCGEAIVYRHITPRFLWKLQKWIGIGKEKKMMKADATFDRVCATYISAKRYEIKQGSTHNSNGEIEDLLTSFMKLDATKYEHLNLSDDRFLKDFIVSFMAAGRDSTASALTWFFWIMSEYPSVLTKILQEINTNIPRTASDQDKSSYVNKLVYLHATLSEVMRLYPPIPFERKSPVKPDVLPSGHKVKSNINILIFLYAMGRMKAVWGEDAMDFKPERWISETGGFRHEPSYKFFSFNAGPRTCLVFDYLKTLHSYPWNWPVLGMLPAVLVRFNRIDDAIWIIEKTNLTFIFRGPWFTRMNALVTVDPANIHHILSSNFSNYVKGPEFKEMFDVYGDAVFNTDADIWKNMRMSSQPMTNHQGFQKLSMNTTRSKLIDVLLPLFNHFAEEGTVVDLQDVFGRFTFDTTMATITGSDPRSLSIEMPEVDEFAKALDNAAEVVLYRHLMPRLVWKTLSWMGLWQEKKMTEASATIDRVCAKYISDKREEIRSLGITHHSEEESGEDILTSSMKLDTIKYEHLNTRDDRFFRDIILTFIVAGRDTIASALTWFFWLMSENPKMVTKIRQEIKTNLPRTGSGQEMFSSTDIKEFLNKLVYLHGALSETMRLYPPIPFERKLSVKQDVLPSGHKIEAKSNIIIPPYALGRMRAVWGEDAFEFKPERWVSETGGLRHEPSFKFLAFNAGPRTCIGNPEEDK